MEVHLLGASVVAVAAVAAVVAVVAAVDDDGAGVAGDDCLGIAAS